MKHTHGQWYKIYESVYCLTKLSDVAVALCSPTTGMTWSSIHIVVNPNSVTEEEFKKLSAGAGADWKFVGDYKNPIV